ncbi:MAG: proline racemase family protein [Ardenticatenaceae bacterium]|nr:proline racemase family protein [Ardenticatenaceae bacterium]MCB9446165.1 proline racemase family protein [Ardenticatenaceae bacterium]
MTLNWQPPDNWLRITTIDAHTAGEPLRVITSGYPDLPGETILAKRRYALEHYDHLRTALMWEPRGHADMYGCILTEPERPSSDLGVLFLHNEGYSTMCGHGIIGLAKVGLDTGLIDKPGDHPVIKMDTPAGLVTAYAERVNGRVTQVSFHNVPSFVYALDQTVDVPGIGPVRYDIAFGGAFYAFCHAEELGVGLTSADFRQLIDVGMRVKTAVMTNHPIRHPFADDLSFLYGTIIVGAAHDPAHHSRNVCIFADGEVDRCPTGTGVSARAALHYARGELALNEPFIVESILGTTFTGQVVETTEFGPYKAIIPQVTGTAHIVGRNELLIDPEDPLQNGFILR